MSLRPLLSSAALPCAIIASHCDALVSLALSDARSNGTSRELQDLSGHLDCGAILARGSLSFKYMQIRCDLRIALVDFFRWSM